jgi:integrase
MKKLNDKAVRAARTDDSDGWLSDGNGLYLRVRASGLKLWLYRYKVGSKTHWVELGSYPELPLVDARIAAAQMAAKRRQGVDPVEEREQVEAQRIAEEEAQRQALAAQITVRDLFERWASVDLIRRKDGGREIRRMFEKDVLPLIGSLAVEDVRKGHVTAVTDALLARGVARMAKLIFALVRQMFRFAVDRDILEFDPTASIRKAKIGGKDTERDRVLSEDEIRALVRQLPEAELSEAAQRAVWLALSTCCRIGELLAARWEHVDLDKGAWWIPPENSKNGKAHTVFLAPFAMSQFQALQGSAKSGPWVFPNRGASGPVCGKTVTKQLGDRQRPGLKPMKGRARAEIAATLVLPGGKWTPHDLRRTGATMMVMLGALPEVAERCLNHVEENKVKRIYQRHSYEGEMREAWRLLGDRLELLTRPDAGNVVTLRSNTAA